MSSSAFELLKNATITGDKAYHDYAYENLLKDIDLRLVPLRKKNSKRPLEPVGTCLMATARKAVETTGIRGAMDYRLRNPPLKVQFRLTTPPPPNSWLMSMSS